MSFLWIVLLASLTVRAADPTSDALQRGLLAEEVHRDLDAAIEAYLSVVAQHDEQRRFAATALFRLGECYRQQGKTQEAIARYQRLLAEFSDQVKLAQLSRQQLDSLGAGLPVASGALTPAAQRQKELLAQELALLEQQLAEVRAQIKVGRAGTADLIPLQREALALQRQMAALDDARRPDLLMDVVVPSNEPAAGITPEELTEIERLRELIRNSPDLINTTTRGDAPLHTAARLGQLAVASFLLESGATVDVRAGGGGTPLFYAVENGHKAMTELLIAAGADVNAGNRQGGTALGLAARLGFIEIAKVLLAAGADINATTEEGFTPLHAAVMQKHLSMMNLLLDTQANLEARAFDAGPWAGYTPLLLAFTTRGPAVVKRLIERGANVDAASATGDRALHIAVLNDATVAEVRAILERHPDLEARGAQKSTPLQLACINRNTHLVRILLEAGANPNARFGSGTHKVRRQPGAGPRMGSDLGIEGKTPLHWAVAQWDHELAQLLLEHGSDPNATDSRGAAPLLAVTMDAGDGGAFVTDPGLIRLLLKAGAESNTADKSGMSLLQHAVRVGAIELVAALLDASVNPNQADPTGATPLHAAALRPDASAMNLLLDHGGKIEFQDAFGNTPLHVAARAGSREVVQLLLDGGPGVNARNKQGATPLNLVESTHLADFAADPGRGLVAAFDRQGRQVRSIAAPPPADIAELLIKHGAEESLVRPGTVR